MKSALPFALGVGGYVLLRWFLPSETALAIVLAGAVATLIGYPLGFVAGHFLSSGEDVETRGYGLVAWANLVAWLIPVVGMALSAATYQFSRHADDRQRFYYWLAMIGGCLALVNAGLGGLGGLAEQQQRTSVAQAGIAPAASERSASRCAYAAIEAWPVEDFKRLCKDMDTGERP